MKNETQHTPGVWEANDLGLIYAPPRNDEDDASILIADCGDVSGDFGTPEQCANARLVAAAPMLLKAVSAALERWDSYDEADAPELGKLLRDAKDAATG